MTIPFEIHVISNSRLTLERFATIGKNIEPYITAIHIREKHLPAKELVYWVNRLLTLGVPREKIIVNDRVDVAAVTQSYGVQLGYQSIDVPLVKSTFQHLRVGKSVHSVMEAEQAMDDGADYLLFGHIFSTQSKRNLAPRGIARLQEIVEAVDIPVIAIGGIKPQHVEAVLKTGAKGIAIMSGIWDSERPIDQIKDYINGGIRSEGNR